MTPQRKSLVRDVVLLVGTLAGLVIALAYLGAGLFPVGWALLWLRENVVVPWRKRRRERRAAREARGQRWLLYGPHPVVLRAGALVRRPWPCCGREHVAQRASPSRLAVAVLAVAGVFIGADGLERIAGRRRAP